MDAWLEGLPVVTTPVGAEGLVRESEDVCTPSTPSNSSPMPGGSSLSTVSGVTSVVPGLSLWGGLYSSMDADAFAADAVRLHEDAALWTASREEGRSLVSDLFDASIRCASYIHNLWP